MISFSMVLMVTGGWLMPTVHSLRTGRTDASGELGKLLVCGGG